MNAEAALTSSCLPPGTDLLDIETQALLEVRFVSVEMANLAGHPPFIRLLFWGQQE